MSTCGCPLCGEHFSSLKAFDRHQLTAYGTPTPVTCQPPASIGLVRNRHGRWAFPADPDKPNPWPARRTYLQP